MTADRIVEFQRLSLVRQQEHLDEALRRMRQAERDAEMWRQHSAAAVERGRRHADELELAHEHNRTLLALLDRGRRESAVMHSANELLTQRLIAVQRELREIRAMLDDAPSITEPGGFAGVQTGEPR